MPRTSAKSQPALKPGKGKSKSPAKTPKESAELTALAREFASKLRKCSPQGRRFVQAKLDGRNNTEAAKLAGYSEKTARTQGSHLLTRVDISEAIAAGWAARGIGPDAVLAGIREMLEFDPGEVMTYVNEEITDWVERPVSAVLTEVRAELEIVQEFLSDLPPRPEKAKRGQEQEPDPYETERVYLEVQATRLTKRETELAVLVRKDPNATVLEKVKRLKRVPFVDLEKVQEGGKAKYIQNVRPTPHGRSIELISHKDVLEMAGRAHGIFRENVVHTGPNGGAIKTETTLRLEDLSGEQLAQRYADLMGQVDDA